MYIATCTQQEASELPPCSPMGCIMFFQATILSQWLPSYLSDADDMFLFAQPMAKNVIQALSHYGVALLEALSINSSPVRDPHKERYAAGKKGYRRDAKGLFSHMLSSFNRFQFQSHHHLCRIGSLYPEVLPQVRFYIRDDTKIQGKLRQQYVYSIHI